jgi:hypothetical protein
VELSTSDEPGIAFRLSSWPDLPDSFRSPRILKALSLMQHGPTTVDVLAMSAGIQKRQIAQLVKILDDQGCVTRISLSEIEGAPSAFTDVHEGGAGTRSARTPLFQRLMHAIRRERAWQDTVYVDQEVRDTIPLALMAQVTR